MTGQPNNDTRFRFTPYPHQVRGTSTLCSKPVFGLFWKMRLGKSKAVIDAACLLLEAGTIDTIIVCCPAQVKAVWLDPDLGEIRRHEWLGVPVLDYSAKTEDLLPHVLRQVWFVSSFEFLRQEDAQGEFPKVAALRQALKNRKVWLVIDEASALGTWNSLQVKAMMRLRYSSFVKRVTLLDGTPAGNSTLQLYSKFALLHKDILGYKNFWHFRGVHCELIQSPFKNKNIKRRNKYFKEVVGFRNLDLLTQKAQPYCQYLGQEVLGLPEKVRTFFSVPLSLKTWKVYRQMRDEMVAEIDAGDVTVNHAAIKVLRLAQICSGFLGGFETEEGCETKELSDETTTAYLGWLKARLEEEPTFKTVVWCRWRAEIERLCDRLEATYTTPQLFVGLQYGGRKDDNFLHPDHPWKGAGVVIAQPQAVQYGVNFSKATAVTYLSQDYNLVTRSQTEDRVQAPGRATTLLTDVLVTGPNGEKTVVHDIIKVLRGKEELANRTVERWREVLLES